VRTYLLARIFTNVLLIFFLKIHMFSKINKMCVLRYLLPSIFNMDNFKLLYTSILFSKR